MRFLKKTMIAVIIIVILSLLKGIIPRISPPAAIFYVNLLGCIQLFILFWAVFTGTLEAFWWKLASIRNAFVNSGIIYLVFCAFFEIMSLFMVHFPKTIPSCLLGEFKYYYENYQRNILQYDSSISEYDSNVFYKMRPNLRGVFRNVEFEDSILTNSAGFRSNEISLSYSRITCAGDSYTLGWGVGQTETYPNALQELLGKPVLDVGMSSYGTARELATVRQLDSFHLDLLIIQYSYNDIDENLAFAESGDKLVVSNHSVYDSAQESMRWSRLYFPGKCFLSLSKIILGHYFGELKLILSPRRTNNISDSASYDKAAKLFINVLMHSGIDFKRTQIIVFDICEFSQLNDKFINAVQRVSNTPEIQSSFGQHVHLLPIAGKLTSKDYFVLDGHLRPSGQRKIARELANIILNLR